MPRSPLSVVTLLAVLWYPDGRMTPYRDGERGTLQEHAVELGVLGQGDPLLRSPSEALTPLPPAGQTNQPVREEPANAATTAPTTARTDHPHISGTPTTPAANVRRTRSPASAGRGRGR